eukprot:430116-Rhodomonas_salina.4
MACGLGFHGSPGSVIRRRLVPPSAVVAYTVDLYQNSIAIRCRLVTRVAVTYAVGQCRTV